MTTFQDLGLDFPLFAAPVEESSDYAGEGVCSCCHESKPHCFKLGIGERFILSCLACGTPNALDTYAREDAPCTSCGEIISFPKLVGGLRVCFDCLRAGKAAFTQDTELGMVRWEDAQTGKTFGIPGDPDPRFPYSISDLSAPNDPWYQAQVAVEDLMELVRTPSFISWQGERWLFCHQRPMIYLGSWRQDDFDKAAPDGHGEKLFTTVVDAGSEEFWPYINSRSVSVYVFRCQDCGELRGYHDAS